MGSITTDALDSAPPQTISAQCGGRPRRGPNRRPRPIARACCRSQSARNAATTAMSAKQRLVRALIRETVVDVDESTREVLLVIHWHGGTHSELRVKKPGPGE